MEGWDVMGLADAINILSATLLLSATGSCSDCSDLFILFSGRHGTFKWEDCCVSQTFWQGELGKVSWEAARDLVVQVYEAMNSGGQ